jgi:hypothetical protein
MDFLINLLAVARLSFLLVDEDGPYSIFSKIRKYFGLVVIINIDGEEEKVALVDTDDSEFYTLMQGILDCKWCTSVWMSILVWALNLSPYTKWLNYILALSMAAILIFIVKDKVHGM